MGCSLEGPDPDPRPVSPAQQARVVQKTPGGSLLLTGASMGFTKAPGDNVCMLEPPPPLCVNAVERVEAMDLSEEDVDEVMDAAPWHVTRWLADLPQDQDGEAAPRGESEAEGCSSTNVPNLSTSAEVAADNASGIISICAANISNSKGLPNATSGMTETRKRSARIRVRGGSELVSEFVDVTNLATLDRNIPNDDELEEPVRHIIGAMESVMDAEADRLPGVSTSYLWKENFDSFLGVPESFAGPTPGPVKDYL